MARQSDESRAEFPAPVIARLLNITERRLQQLAKEGIVPKASRGRYPLAGCVRGYVTYLQDLAEQSRKVERDGVRSTLLQEQTKKLQIENAEAEGRLVSVEEVHTVLTEVATIYASQLDGLAGRLAGGDSVLREKIFDGSRSIRSETADRLNAYAERLAVGKLDNPAPKARPVGVGRGKKKAPARKRGTRPVSK